MLSLSENILKKYLKLENGIPSSGTILRVLARIDAKENRKGIHRIRTRNICKESCGKRREKRLTERPSGTVNTHRQTKKKQCIKQPMPFQLMPHSLGVCFGQVKTEEKSNEITAIPELLDLLDIKGRIITIDALVLSEENRRENCRKESGLCYFTESEINNQSTTM